MLLFEADKQLWNIVDDQRDNRFSFLLELCNVLVKIRVLAHERRVLEEFLVPALYIQSPRLITYRSQDALAVFVVKLAALEGRFSLYIRLQVLDVRANGFSDWVLRA